MAAALGTIVLACHICFQIEYTNARAAEAQAWAAAESARQLREVTARAGELARNVEALRLANQDIRSFLRELKAMVDELARMRPELDRLVSDRAADHRHILEQIHVLGGNLAVLQQKVSAAARRIDDLDKKTDQVPDLPSVKPEGATSPREVPSEVPPAPPAPKKNGYMIKPDPNAPRPPQDDTRGGYMH